MRTAANQPDEDRFCSRGTVSSVTEVIDTPPDELAEEPIDVELLAVELLEVLNGLRRTTRRVVRRRIHEHALAPAEVEVLVTVVERPGCGVRDVAHVLGLAANTVSTLVGSLAHGGLLARTEDPNDRRVAVLRPTPAGRGRVRRWRDERADVMARALSDLSPEQLVSLHDGLEPLRAVASTLFDAGEEQLW
jgi:DNA-binding MarR family transcriptional regulator